MKDRNLQVQNAKWIPSKINTTKSMLKSNCWKPDKKFECIKKNCATMHCIWIKSLTFVSRKPLLSSKEANGTEINRLLKALNTDTNSSHWKQINLSLWPPNPFRWWYFSSIKSILFLIWVEGKFYKSVRKSNGLGTMWTSLNYFQGKIFSLNLSLRKKPREGDRESQKEAERPVNWKDNR